MGAVGSKGSRGKEIDAANICNSFSNFHFVLQGNRDTGQAWRIWGVFSRREICVAWMHMQVVQKKEDSR